MFGTTWTSQFPTEVMLNLAKREWAEALSAVDLEQIRAAFERVKRSGDAFPPSLPKFLSYCRVEPDWAHRGEAYRMYEQRALPSPVNREVGRSALSVLRRQVGLSKGGSDGTA
ncbi:MAG: hypothetical protein IBX56_07820 [Methylomicrobium sp.]|nr:hypothetical protein [Methylomicrobium sp.]